MNCGCTWAYGPHATKLNKDVEYMFQNAWSKFEVYAELLSNNPNAIGFIENNPGWVCYLVSELAANPALADWLTWSEVAKEHSDEINWAHLSRHAGSMCWLKRNPSRIDWVLLSENNHPDAIVLLKANPEMINWGWLSRNTHPDAIEMLRENLGKINWGNLCANESYPAMELLKGNLDKIHWDTLSCNPFAVGLLSENKEKIVWNRMYINSGARELILEHFETFNENWKWRTIAQWGCSNPCIFDLVEDVIEHEQEKADLLDLASNPAIFEYDYAAMWRRCMVFKEDLMKNRFHPDNMSKMEDWGFWGREEDEYELPY